MAHSKFHFNGYNFFICWLVSLGQIAFGYPASIIGTTLAQPSFLVYMKLIDPATEGLAANADQLIGATSGVFQVDNLALEARYPQLTRDRPEHSSTFSLQDGSRTAGDGKQVSTGVVSCPCWEEHSCAVV